MVIPPLLPLATFPHKSAQAWEESDPSDRDSTVGRVADGRATSSSMNINVAIPCPSPSSVAVEVLVLEMIVRTPFPNVLMYVVSSVPSPCIKEGESEGERKERR